MNLKRAYQYVISHISNGEPVNISLLKRINNIVAKDDSLVPVDFRTGSVGVTLLDGSRHAPNPVKEIEVARVLQKYRTAKRFDDGSSRSFHALLYAAAGFWDGNKRTATLFAND